MLMLRNGNAMDFEYNERTETFTVSEYGPVNYITEMNLNELINLLEYNGHWNLALAVDECYGN